MRVKIVIILTALATAFYGDDRAEVVVFNGLQSKTGALLTTPGAPLELSYGLTIRRFWPDGEHVKGFFRQMRARNPAAAGYDEWLCENSNVYEPLNDDFARVLASAKLFYIGQYAGAAACLPLNAYPDAIRQFLAAGGVMVFDYGATSPALTAFLQSVGTVNPAAKQADLKAGQYTAVAWGGADLKTSLLTMPHDLSKLNRMTGYGWWEKWADNQYAPFRNVSDPEHCAAMIIQEQVNGRGRVVFNQIPGVFRSAAQGGNKKLLENVLSWIFECNILEHKQKVLESRGGPGASAW